MTEPVEAIKLPDGITEEKTTETQQQIAVMGTLDLLRKELLDTQARIMAAATFNQQAAVSMAPPEDGNASRIADLKTAFEATKDTIVIVLALEQAREVLAAKIPQQTPNQEPAPAAPASANAYTGGFGQYL